MIELIGYLAAIMGTICWIPQVLKVWRTRQTKDLSLITNMLILITMTLWLIYGIAIGSAPLVAAKYLVYSVRWFDCIGQAHL